MAALTERTVLVTGAFGNVGRYVLRRLDQERVRVVATDVASRDHRRLASEWVAGATASQARAAEWVDLTDPADVSRLVADVDPDAVVHLAGVIPPAAYRDPVLARAVNVDAVAHLADAVAARETQARVVFSSSMATYGSRNPHTGGVVTAQTPTRPADVYGAHKVEAEQILRDRLKDVAILRLGAVIYPEGSHVDGDTLFMTAQAPGDGHLHGVDARDTATALVRATVADCSGATLLIGGDASWQRTQDELMQGVTAAAGLPGLLPAGLPGDPADDDAWFCVCWMDTTEAQRLLSFQEHSWDDTRADIAAHTGIKRRVLPLVAPLGRLALGLMPAYRGRSGEHAPMWTAVAQRWGTGVLVD